MNILKAFKDDKYMDLAFDNFVQYSGKHLEVSLSNGIVKTAKGDKVYFRAIDTLEKAHWLGGICFQKIEYVGLFDFMEPDEEIINYLNSRIRG